MKLLIEKRKWTLAIFFVFLMFFGTHLLGFADVTPLSERTPQVRDAIVATVPGINAAADITEAHLAAITTLNIRSKNIATLKADDFDGLTALSDLNLYGNHLRRLPDGLFEGLTALTTLRLGGNTMDPLPMPVTLKKVAEGQFKAVAPIGATFDYGLSITVTNGSITGGTPTVTIPHGRMESETFTVARTPNTTGEVTVDIQMLPRLPSEHYGYALVRYDTLPLSVIPKINTAPVFIDGRSVTRSVAENTDAGTAIGAAIPATDAENDTLTYTLSGADASAFDIDTATGQLETKAALDYEIQNVWTLTITVSDGNLTDTITATINVTDIDETVNTAPSFYEGESTTRAVFENTAVGLNIGTPVLATDSPDDFLRYTLGGVHADAFAIDTATGQLKTKAPLDYETQRLYTVTITVEDEALSDTITVIISVMDVNDTVSSPGFLPVIERTPEVRDAIVAAVPNATDAATVTEAEVAAITTLNLRSRGISFLKTGDFSGMTALSNLNLYGNHLSSLPPGIFTGVPALTTLRLGGNVLDPLPLIVSLQRVGADAFKAVMPTGAPFNIVLPIGVTGSTIRGGVTSVMIPQGRMESSPFTVIGTGTETTQVAFRRFPRLPFNHYGYTIAQSTVCNRTEQVAAAIAAAVGVEDCSIVTELDLAAITSLDLSNAAITALKAGDFDGMLSLRTLSLEGNTLTRLPRGIFDDLVSLTELSLNANQLTTLPRGIFTNLTSLTHLYLQRNDLRSLSAGVFDGTPYLRSLLLSHNNLTSLPAGIFEGLTALDQLHLRWNPDAASQLPLVIALEKVGTNGFKAVVPTGAPFEITLPIKVANGSLVDGATALLIPKGSVESPPVTLTRTPNTIDAVTVVIETPLPMHPATHNGYVLVTSATRPLEVIEQINVPPVFTEGADTLRTIAENVATDTNVGAPVTATDANKGTTLTYRLDDGADAAAFDVDSKTGQLKTKASLDFETKKTYAVTITASDGELTGTIVVTINVSDVNEAPVFAADSLTTHAVAENTPAGENIGTPYKATDVDGDTLTYRLDDGTDAAAFDLDSKTGQLKTKASLDFETQKTYPVTLTVSDGKLTGTLAATINISDVNEAPIFAADSLTTHAVAENTPAGENIGTPYRATDADGDTLTYRLDDGADADAFDLDSKTGQLKTKAALDFETQKTYAVTITVSDGKLTGTLAATINISDVNEAPAFATDSLTTHAVAENTPADSLTTHAVAENTPAGENIGTPYKATDADGDTLTYRLDDGTDAAAFDLDSETGQLKTKAALDFETKKTYSVTITVSDGEFTDTITVTIDVTDVEENRAPTFTEGSTATRSIRENTRPGVNIGSAVSATDTDADTLTYSLGGTDADSFDIDSTSGQLQTKAPLNYERKSSYSVTVSVSDGKGGSHSITVTINIENVVENRDPIFTEGSTATRSIPENTPANQNIGSPVSATDPGDTLTYTLGGTDAASFLIVSNSGQLQTKAPLDYETKDSYSVTVSVSDRRGRSNSITVTINVIDRGPTFDASTAIRSVLGDKAANSNIGDPFSATSDPGTTLTYSLSGTDATHFQIGSTPGQLQTGTAALTYSETKLSYSVTLTATDSNSESSSIAVTINVIKPVTGRTSQVKNVIVATIDGVTDPADVTEAHLRSITFLNLYGQSITSLTPGDFDGLTELRVIDLDNNSLTALPPGIFDKNTKLTALRLNDNALTALPDDIFDKNTKLTTIELDENSLTALPAGIFDKNTQLTEIELYKNSLTALPPDIFEKNTKLTEIDLGDNKLTALPPGIFDKNTELTTLYLYNNSLTALPPDIFEKNTKLTVLNLSDNNITDMSALENVTSLMKLYVKGNPISNYEPLQPHTTAIQNVRVDLRINLNNNPPVFTEGDSTTRSVFKTGTNIGTVVGATDADTHTLKYTLGGTDAASFSIVSGTGQLQTKAGVVYETQTSYTVTVTVNDGNSGGNRITVTINVIKPVAERTSQVQSGIVTAINDPSVTISAHVTEAHLREIKSLDLNRQSITSLTSGDFDGLTKLETLRLDGNSLTALPAGIFDKNTKLKTIHLGTNALTALPAGIFDKNTELKNLYLVTNKLPELPDGIFDKNTELMILNLADNKLPELPDGIFDKNTKLTEIYLHKNVLTTLPDHVFDKNTELETLRLGTNKLPELPDGIFDKNTKLKTLNLFTNKLTALRAGIFDKNTKLTEIYLHKNALTTLPAHVFDKNTKLTTLRLNENNITDMSAFATVTSTTHSLTHLYVKGNPISDYGPLRPHDTAIQATGPADRINLNNNPPVFTQGTSTTRAVQENTATNTNIGAVVAATDADTTDTLTYTLGGTDAASFSIVGSSGQLQTKDPLDFETKTSYTVTVTVYDGNSGGDRITVTINVTDVAGAAPSVQVSPVIPENTSLLTNFPNPFNPETWIPYQLAKPAKVTLTLYDIRGVVVRELKLGHQAAGFYHSRSRAIHWDGRNMFGEKVATGVYFYSLKAGDYTATRKLLIRK